MYVLVLESSFQWLLQFKSLGNIDYKPADIVTQHLLISWEQGITKHLVFNSSRRYKWGLFAWEKILLVH